MFNINFPNKKKHREIIKVHCDGSCMEQIGGIGIVICTNSTETLICRGSFPHTTNNRMELLAFIYAVYYLQKFMESNPFYKDFPVDLYADSKYLVDGYNSWIESWEKNNWKNSTKQIVLNLDLWQEILIIKREFNYFLAWEKAHDINHWNNKADLLAKAAVDNNNFSFCYQTNGTEEIMED